MFRVTDIFLLAAAVLIYAGVAAILLAARKHRGNKPNYAREALKLALFVYALVVLRFTEFTRFSFMASYSNEDGALNLVPFRVIAEEIVGMFNHAPHVRTIDVNLIGNVILFMPLGLLVPAIWPKTANWSKILLIGCAASVCIETMQYVLTYLGFINRMADIDDVILNTLGAVLGYAVYSWFRHAGEKPLEGTDSETKP